MDIYKITYKGNKYYVRELLVKDEDDTTFCIKISVESLAIAISPNGSFDDIDQAGDNVDQGIYFYISDEDMQRLKDCSSNTFAEYCSKYVDLGDFQVVKEKTMKVIKENI